MTHLQSIETRQKKSVVRDALFVICVGIASLVAVSSVSTAATAMSAMR